MPDIRQTCVGCSGLAEGEAKRYSGRDVATWHCLNDGHWIGFLPHVLKEDASDCPLTRGTDTMAKTEETNGEQLGQLKAWQEEIQGLSRRRDKHQKKLDDLDDKRRTERKMIDGFTRKIDEIVAAGPGGLLPFPDEESEGEGEGGTAVATSSWRDIDLDAMNPKTWREQPQLAGLKPTGIKGLTPTKVKAICNFAKVETLGGLVDWINDGGDLRNINGFTAAVCGLAEEVLDFIEANA